ncbi:MAG: GHKL domain-containing protein [Lachnospiraceae bacterium]|nr:GHKL domain-containing protein [Lachnospiraceae bacterium]
MQFDTYTIVYLITNLFSIAVNHRFMMAFFEQRRTKTGVCVLSYLSYFVVTSLLYLYVDIPILTLLANYGLVLVISINYKSGMLKRVISAFFIVLFCGVLEIIVTAFTGYFQYSIFEEGSYSNSLGVIAARLATYMGALILYNFKAIRRSNKIKRSVWFASVLIPVITFVLHLFIAQSKDVTQIEVIIAAILIYLVNVTAFYLYDSLADSYIKLAENAVMEKERELYYNQCIMMQTSTNELRAFRHDLKNQMISVSELMSAERYEEAKELMGELSGKLNTKTLFGMTGNIPIDSIINYKLQSAGNEQIRVDAEIAVPEELNMDISDSITVLGNLLDNALYALQQIEESKRYLKLKVMFDKGRLMIHCANPYVTEVRYENGEIISTKSDRKEHGFGLKNIEAVAEKYNGCMNVNHNDGVFTVDVLLYLTFDCKK